MHEPESACRPSMDQYTKHMSWTCTSLAVSLLSEAMPHLDQSKQGWNQTDTQEHCAIVV